MPKTYLYDTPTNTRRIEIHKTLIERQVSRLCHMTQLEKVIPILSEESGILASDFISDTKLLRNDIDRLDGKTAHISTSIEYPNYWYYRMKKDVYPNMSNWAVLFIDPVVCQDDNTLFCPLNAATSHGALINGNVTYLKASFAESLGMRSRTSNMLSCCPTDDQAEVLIYKSIPRNFITGIAFENVYIAKEMIRIFDEFEIDYPDIYVASDLFSSNTSRLIRAGIRPEERLIERSNRLWRRDLCS